MVCLKVAQKLVVTFICECVLANHQGTLGSGCAAGLLLSVSSPSSLLPKRRKIVLVKNKSGRTRVRTGGGRGAACMSQKWQKKEASLFLQISFCCMHTHTIAQRKSATRRQNQNATLIWVRYLNVLFPRNKCGVYSFDARAALTTLKIKWKRARAENLKKMEFFERGRRDRLSR
jgi:hypothetical protein